MASMQRILIQRKLLFSNDYGLLVHDRAGMDECCTMADR